MPKLSVLTTYSWAFPWVGASRSPSTPQFTPFVPDLLMCENWRLAVSKRIPMPPTHVLNAEQTFRGQDTQQGADLTFHRPRDVWLNTLAVFHWPSYSHLQVGAPHYSHHLCHWIMPLRSNFSHLKGHQKYFHREGHFRISLIFKLLQYCPTSVIWN